MSPLAVRSPAARLFRIGRLPDAWESPDWSRQGEDKTFGNRFDDLMGEYRVLYASSQQLGCFVECLACFRSDLTLIAALREIKGDDEAVGFNVRDWIAKRAIGSARVKGQFADIYASGWLSLLRVRLASTAVALGIRDIDLCALQSPSPRRLTQEASRIVRSRKFDGVYYHSRFGTEFENWAIFEPWTLDSSKSIPIAVTDPDLNAAMSHLGIRSGDGVS